MKQELRKSPRFAEIGRVDAPDICLFSGILENISESGCKVKFPVSLDINYDSEYELKILCARKDFLEPFILIANVVWFKNEKNSTEIGFKIIRSPSTRYFEKFITNLKREKLAFEEDENLLKKLKK